MSPCLALNPRPPPPEGINNDRSLTVLARRLSFRLLPLTFEAEGT